MIEIKFARADAAGAFVSMAEGMWENERDDSGLLGSDKLALLNELLEALGTMEGTTITLADKFLPLVKDVIDNCADNAHDMGIDDEGDLEENEDAALACAPFDVSIRESV